MLANGRNPYFISGGGSKEIDTLGYVSSAQQLLGQSEKRNLKLKLILLTTGSAGTHAGIIADFQAYVYAITLWASVCASPAMFILKLSMIVVVKIAAPLTDRPFSRDRVVVDDGYVGLGYGIPTQGILQAKNLVAHRKAFLLDPVYSGKGMTGLIGLIYSGQIARGGDVVFLHTGGAVSLFAYEDQFFALDKMSAFG